MENGTQNIILIILWFVLPILPAFLLFKFLPMKDTDVSGPFKGLQIKLTGAFAAYFLIFLLSMTVFNKLITKEEERYEIWTIEGSVYDATTKRPVKDFVNPVVKIIPRYGSIDNGQFNIKVIGSVKEGGLVEFPFMIVQADRYVAENLESLNYIRKSNKPKKNWDFDTRTKRAILKNPIFLATDEFQDSTQINPTVYVEPNH